MTFTDFSKAAISIRLGSVLNIRDGEGRPVGLLSGLYFILILAFVLVQATTFGLFIAEFGAQNLPYAYLSIAVLASLVAFLYLRLSDRLPFTRLLYINLGFIALMCIFFWLGLISPLTRWFIFFLPFWFQTMINLVNLVVWPVAGRVFDLRQAKRLFGLVGAGNWLATILGGFIIAPLVSRLGISNLLLLAAFWVLIALIVLRVIIRICLTQATALPSPRPAARPSQKISSPLQDPYIRLIFAYILLWWISFYFVDNIFYDRAAMQYPEADQLAGFLGQLISAMGILALITTTFLTGRIISRFGLLAGLLIMPATVTTVIALLALTGMLLQANAYLFWLASFAKLVNVALGFSLSQSAGTLLYQPLPGDQRARTQTVAEGIVQPLAIGLAGLALLLFNTLLHFNAVGLSYIFLVIAVGWILVILRINRQYPKAISRALVKRQWGETSIAVLDPSCSTLL